ncbi:S-layer homology domain-containing protein [Sporosarcina cyprini]|uniref:S-layer homology domain-containing protein n=1 Tax=Sporosarcina cyprini TaxID=2910523 RepID=UPI001EDEF35F|nr:S-layer homology domain-containing protein [Sporosarcina cyprini]MCG3088389.1 S-layer homology domain-containing protein [Sporosarcina cyprini]
MKKLIVLLVALLLAVSLPVTGTAAGTTQFSDVPQSKHFAEAVYELAGRNIIGGYPDGTFKPGNPITRGQAAAIIAKMLELDTDQVKNPGFKDVSPENGYYKAIAALAEKEIIGGYEDGRFGPNDPIKRGQMASILVKAFDLPRYAVEDKDNPFKDVKNYSYVSHSQNILIIYHLGITTGTSPTTFSPNASITRGQAAKLLKAAEESKPQMKTLQASEFGWEKIEWFNDGEKNPGVFKAALVTGRKTPAGYTGDRLQIVPLKEGTGTLSFGEGNIYFPDEKNFKKYYVHVKKTDGEWSVSLEETDDHFPTAAGLEMTQEQTKQVEQVSLSTMEGEPLSDSVAFKYCKKGMMDNLCIDIDKPGQYIATVRYKGGEKNRYGIEVTEKTAHFYYGIRTLQERTSHSVDLSNDSYYSVKPGHKIGKHIIPQDSEQIAVVTREKDTNIFRAEAKKGGNFIVEFPDDRVKVYSDGHVFFEGIAIDVQQLGNIVYVTVRPYLHDYWM